MGGRYLVTGVQLAMIQMNCGDDSLKVINKIIERQFIWNSDKNINKDIITLVNKLEKE